MNKVVNLKSLSSLPLTLIYVGKSNLHTRSGRVPRPYSTLSVRVRIGFR